MSNLKYQLPLYTSLLSHFRTIQPIVHDQDDSQNFKELTSNSSDDFAKAELLLRAKVRSGDYFITLATELDQVARGVRMTIPEAGIELERAISELLLLNRHYQIIKSDHKITRL